MTSCGRPERNTRVLHNNWDRREEATGTHRPVPRKHPSITLIRCLSIISPALSTAFDDELDVSQVVQALMGTNDEHFIENPQVLRVGPASQRVGGMLAPQQHERFLCHGRRYP